MNREEQLAEIRQLMPCPPRPGEPFPHDRVGIAPFGGAFLKQIEPPGERYCFPASVVWPPEEPTNKPPLVALLSRNLHDLQRAKDLHAAIGVYIDNQHPVPHEWYDELREITDRMGA